MDIADGRVLVTGAGGFIGSHVVEALVAAGARVRALVRYNGRQSRGWLADAALFPDQVPPDRVPPDRVEVVAGDIRDPFQAAALVEGCTVVLHLAALIAIPYSYAAPASYVETNVTGTLNLLEAARRAGVARFVQTSTSEVYGTAVRVPMDEEHRLHPQSPYAASKVASDQLALSYHRSFGLPVVVLRPFNAFGPRQSPRAVLPGIILQLLGGAPVLRLGALHPTRDFTFAPDLARAFLAAATAEAAVGEVINVGSGFEITVGEAARLLCTLTGRGEVPVETDPARLRPGTSEVERLYADAGRAARLLGWRPAMGGLEGFRQGLERTIAWYADPARRALFTGDGHAL